MDTFDPDPVPDVGSGSDVTYRVRRTRLGDGYEERIADGINVRERTESLVWPVLSVAAADALTDFFDAHPGWVAFLWTHPHESAPRKWVVEKWARRETGSERRSITATLREVFDL